MSLKPVCMKCHRFFKPHKTGFWFTEGMPIGPDQVEPGVEHAHKWRPYKVWQGDIYKCDGCQTTIITGCAQQPIRVQHQSDFAAIRRGCNADQFQVNDC